MNLTTEQRNTLGAEICLMTLVIMLATLSGNQNSILLGSFAVVGFGLLIAKQVYIYKVVSQDLSSRDIVIADLTAEVDALEEKLHVAETESSMFHGLMDCYRIKVVGGTNINKGINSPLEEKTGYTHIGVEFWSERPPVGAFSGKNFDPGRGDAQEKQDFLRFAQRMGRKYRESRGAS